MYLPINFQTCHVSALLDTGSSINLMSQELFDKLSSRNKISVEYCNESIILANNQAIRIDCIAQVSAVISGQQQTFSVYVKQLLIVCLLYMYHFSHFILTSVEFVFEIILSV